MIILSVVGYAGAYTSVKGNVKTTVNNGQVVYEVSLHGINVAGFLNSLLLQQGKEGFFIRSYCSRHLLLL
jgi:hypothetical protein